jgi:aryl-alcohol dehydrogenase-like predicted oxidoreductase
MIPGLTQGCATKEGTKRYCDRFEKQREAGHFRRSDWVPEAGDLWLSSIGMGTYLGDPTAEFDAAYSEAATAALQSGVNVLDTAINYRHQRSERSLGAALEQLISAGTLHRDEVLVCTKAGFLSFDQDMPSDPREYFTREYIRPGLVDPDELAGGMHCMGPRYLENQLQRSRANLGLETVDVFYVHNPETQLGSVSFEVFRRRLLAAFQMLEQAVDQGKIRYYGTATWNGYRVPPGQAGYMSLEGVVEMAREAGGQHHHFRFVQVPFNLAMPEAYGLHNQGYKGQALSLLDAARHLGVLVMGSATLHQGALTEGLPDFIHQRLGFSHDWQNAIQFARSAPGLATALVGMSQKKHVQADLAVASRPPAPLEEWKKLFQSDAPG